MSRLARISTRLLIFCATLGCGARSGLLAPGASGSGGAPTATSSCGAPQKCVVPGHACQTPKAVDAACDERTRQWSCPSGARPYARAAQATARCLPFHGSDGLEAIGAWGFGSLTPLPIDDEHCLWVADSATLAGGLSARNVALAVDPQADFAACPAESSIVPTPIVTLEGGEDPSLLVTLQGGYRLGGVTRVLYRVFQLSASGGFGVIELGGGIAHYDPVSGRIPLPAIDRPFPWGNELDLGDAWTVSEDGAFAYVWGCALPGPFLEEGCALARIDQNDAIDLLDDNGSWVHASDSTLVESVFASGPWQSSVFPVSSGLRHVFSVSFGTDLKLQSAPGATGPWSGDTTLATCDLPTSDPHAFCAGPVVHPELSDPTRPGEIALSYSIGSTAPASTNPDDYWPRLTWLKLPE